MELLVLSPPSTTSNVSNFKNSDIKMQQRRLLIQALELPMPQHHFPL
jgi:hypothetical protein